MLNNQPFAPTTSVPENIMIKDSHPAFYPKGTGCS